MLYGGSSTRMGTSKAWLTVGTEYLLQRVVRMVSRVVEPVVVVGQCGQAVPPLPDNVAIVHDVKEGCGPLAGIAAGFEALAAQCEAAFTASCDHPLVKPEFIRRLVELLGDAPGVVPRHAGHSYPLLAVYRLDTQALLNGLLARGELRVRDFARQCGAKIIESAQLADVDSNLDSLRNVNSPESYAEVLRLLEA